MQLVRPLTAARPTRMNALRDYAAGQRFAAPQRGDLLDVSAPPDGGAEDDGTQGLIQAVTQAALGGYFHDRKTRQEHALDMEKFREAQRLTGLRDEHDYQRSRADKLEDYGRARADQLAETAAQRDFLREEHGAAAADRRAAAAENDERDAANRPNAVMNKFAESRLAEGDLPGAARLGLKVPVDAPEMKQAASELAQQAAGAARPQYEQMARQIVADHPVGAPLLKVGQKMRALQDAAKQRFAGDPAAAAAIADAVQRAVEDELGKRPKAREPRLHVVDEKTGAVYPHLVDSWNRDDPGFGDPPAGMHLEWRR